MEWDKLPRLEGGINSSASVPDYFTKILNQVMASELNISLPEAEALESSNKLECSENVLKIRQGFSEAFRSELQANPNTHVMVPKPIFLKPFLDAIGSHHNTESGDGVCVHFLPPPNFAALMRYPDQCRQQLNTTVRASAVEFQAL